MNGTYLEDGYFWTTPGDMLAFFAALAQGELISADASSNMVELLKRQRLNDAIPALLPAEAVAAHKTGKLPGVINDAGIVYGAEGRYVVAMLSREADEEQAASAIARVALLAYERYTHGGSPVEQ